ncbi:hypothetical protein PS1_016047 [Malus domestica]
MRGGGRRKKPQLLVISRGSTRCCTNPRQITKMARRLGNKVTDTNAGRNMSRIAEVVNFCDVLNGGFMELPSQTLCSSLKMQLLSKYFRSEGSNGLQRTTSESLRGINT